MSLIKLAASVAVLATLLSTASFAGMSRADIMKEGRKVFTTKSLGNCLACHSVQGDDSIPQTGTLGPRLANMDTYPKEYLASKIWDPNKTNPNTIMPPMGRNNKITKAQIDAIVVYLQETTKTK
jgi:sulfur-oxidizing protein SoxX